jgi:hypothetical protein
MDINWPSTKQEGKPNHWMNMWEADYVSLELALQMAIVMEKICLNSFG